MSARFQLDGGALAHLERTLEEILVGNDGGKLETVLTEKADEDRAALILDVAHSHRSGIPAIGRRQELQFVCTHADHATVDGDDVVSAHEARHEFGARCIEDLARISRLLDLAVAHHNDQVGKRHRLFLTVRDMDEGDAEVALEALEFGPHLDPQERIERRQRFVEQQDRRVGDERTGQGNALLLTAGQLRRQSVGEALHGDKDQHLFGAGITLRLVGTAHFQ